jgi:serine/threonine protein kinase
MPPAPLSAETIIDGRYALQERLTDFGLGEVWKAQDNKFRDRFVAVKFLRPLEGAPTKLPDALLAHFRAVREIRHPAVLPIVNQGIHDGRPFVVHEHFEGASLGTRLDEARASGTTLRLGVVAAIFDGFCAALGVIHARRPPLVHDALSPASVLVGPLPAEGDAVECRLIDIGLGPWCEPFEAPRQSARSVRCQAPEQLAGAARTPATDVFGFGLVALEALADLPDADASLTAVRGYQGRTDVPDAVWALLLDATRDSVEARPADGNALRSALTEGWKGPVTVAGAPPATATPTATPAAPEGPAAADGAPAASDEPQPARPIAPPSLDVTVAAISPAADPAPEPLALPTLAPLALPALPVAPFAPAAPVAAPPPAPVDDDLHVPESRTIMRPAPSEADPDDDASATSVDLSKQVSSALGQSVGETQDLGDDVAALLGSQGSSATVDVSEAAAAVLGEIEPPEVGTRTVMRDDAMLAFTAKLNELAATRQRAANQGPVLAGGVYALPALPQSPAAPAEPLPLPTVRSTPPAAAPEVAAVVEETGGAKGLPGWAWALAAFIVAAGAATAWLVLRS